MNVARPVALFMRSTGKEGRKPQPAGMSRESEERAFVAIQYTF